MTILHRTPNRVRASSLVTLCAGFVLLICHYPAEAESDLSPLKQLAVGNVNEIKGDITKLAGQLWQHAELALTEKNSSKDLSDYLESQGFRVKRKVADMPTAFIAEWGEGKPVIGVVAEFDALPGLGNAVQPKKNAA